MDREAFEAAVGPHLGELRAHCYRMLGSVHDADDATQDALMRAWRGLEGSEERVSLRGWLHRIATHACLDMIAGGKATRTLPAARAPASKLGDPRPGTTDEAIWIEPCPDNFAAAAARESVALDFLVALQELPPKERAVLLLRDVVGLPASEVAEGLGLTIAAADSALQHARDAAAPRPRGPRPSDAVERELLARYLDAWERADVAQLVSLLHDDAKLSMPPRAIWFQGKDTIGASLSATVLAPSAEGLFRGMQLSANGMPALAMYRRDGETFAPFALHLLDLEGDKIREIIAFLEPRRFKPFALPSFLR